MGLWADRTESGLEQTYRKLQTNLRVGRAVSIPWRHSVSSMQLDLYGVGTRRPRNWYLGWCCPGQCHHSVSRKEKTSSGSCVRGHLVDFLSRRDRFLYYTRRFLTKTRHILTRISWFCVGSARLFKILWDSVWFLVGHKKK